MRKFLVILDDSRECLNAMRFAAMRAANTGGGVQILSVIPPDEFNHWIGVGEIMREEAKERIHAHFEVFAKWMRDRQGVDPAKIKVSVILIMMKMEEVKKTGPLTSSPKIDFFSSLRVTFLAINYFLIKSSIQY